MHRLWRVPRLLPGARSVGAIRSRRLDPARNTTAGGWPALGFDCGSEHIAGSAHRLDQPGLVGIGVELAAEPADRNIDRAVKGPAMPAVDQIEQPIAAQH